MSARPETARHQATRKAFRLNVWSPVEAQLGFAGHRRKGRFPPDHVVQLRLAFGAPYVANTTVGTVNLQGHEFVVPPHCATSRWAMHKNQPYGCLHDLGLEVLPPDGQGRVRLAHGKRRSSRLPLSGSEGKDSQRVQVARAVASGTERPAVRERARLAADFLALPRRTLMLIETFAPLAEGAILGISQGSVCTSV